MIIQSKGYSSTFMTSTIRHADLSAEAGTTQHHDTPETVGALGRALKALQTLQTELVDSGTEFHLISELNGLVRQLRSSYSARTLEVQFGVLGQLRQFLLWAPMSLLEQQEMRASTWIALSHIYGIGVALEPAFSEWGPILCGGMALHSLEEVHGRIEMRQVKSMSSEYFVQAVVPRRPVTR